MRKVELYWIALCLLKSKITCSVYYSKIQEPCRTSHLDVSLEYSCLYSIGFLANLEPFNHCD